MHKRYDIEHKHDHLQSCGYLYMTRYKKRLCVTDYGYTSGSNISQFTSDFLIATSNLSLVHIVIAFLLQGFHEVIIGTNI